MNIVDMLKEQLKGDAGNTLAAMVGAKGKQMEKILGVVLPSVLSSFASMASGKFGADRLATAINDLDPKDLGDASKMLDSETIDNGGKLIGSLLGGELFEGIAEHLAKFTGLQGRTIKKSIGYLAPLALATVVSSFKGTKPDGPAIAKLFEDQKGNIAEAVPSDLSLDSVPGFKDLAKLGDSTGDKQASNIGKGPGQLLVPISVLASLIAAIFFFINSAEQASARKDKTGNAIKQSSSGQSADSAGAESSNVVSETIKQ